MADSDQSMNFIRENAQANALTAAQQRSRVDDNILARGKNNKQSKKNAPQKQNIQQTPTTNPNAQAEEEYLNENNQRQQVYLLKRRGMDLKKTADKDMATAESMTISNRWIDLTVSGIIELGKATLEILIGFLILPAGFIMKTVKFFFDKQISSLKSSSQKKNEQGEKFLAQAAKLEGKKNPFKRGAQAAAEPLKNYIEELLSDFSPFGFSPSIFLKTNKEGMWRIYKIIFQAVFFCVAIGISLLILATLFLLLLEIACNSLLLCKIATDVFGLKVPETVLKAIK